MFARSRLNTVLAPRILNRGFKKAIDTVPAIPFQNVLTFVRVDFNVPLNKKDGSITDDTRIKESIPTIKYLVDHGAKVVLASHCGRPDGKPNAKMTMKPMADRLGKLMSKPVSTTSDCIGPQVTEAISNMKSGDILMLENTRFHKEEEENDKEFARKLSNGAKIFVNDAFGTAHRAHASTAGVAEFCEQKLSGFLIQKELKYLKASVEKPNRPFTAIIGGAKLSTKLPVIKSLLSKCDNIIIGGAMMFTFLKYQGVSVGDSLVEEEFVGKVKDLLAEAQKNNCKLVIPVDTITATEIKADAATTIVDFAAAGIPAGSKGLDIGPKSQALFDGIIKNSKTVLWNGPMGVFEMKPFASGTVAVANSLAGLTQAGGVTIVGGGDTAAAVTEFGLGSKMSHISTGGGASLEFLEGNELPGVAVLDDAK